MTTTLSVSQRPQSLPRGYGVLQTDNGQWYPVELQRFYAEEYPEGILHLVPLSWYAGIEEAHYSRRYAAVAHCCEHAAREEGWQRWKWEQLASLSDVYPDRCSHYLDEIMHLTGRAPSIHSGIGGINLWIPCFCCPTCARLRPGYTTSGISREEALENAAQHLYAHRCLCQDAWHQTQPEEKRCAFCRSPLDVAFFLFFDEHLCLPCAQAQGI